MAETEKEAKATPTPERKESPRKVRLRYAGPAGSPVGRLIFEERIILELGETVEVSPGDARGIKREFGRRYEIEEVKE